MKKGLKIVGIIILLVLLLCGGLTLSLRIPAVQNYVAHILVNYVSKRLGTKVSIDRFEWNVFRNIDVKGFYMADKKGDTLIYAGNLNVDISYWSLVKKQFKIKGVTLDNAKIRLVNDSLGNLNIATLFASDKPATPLVTPNKDTIATAPNVLIELHKVSLNNTDFRLEDQKKHSFVKVVIPTCDIDINQFALQKKLIDIKSIDINGVHASIIAGVRDTTKPKPIEKISFLPPGWEIKWAQAAITHSSFEFDNMNKASEKKGVDFNHIWLTDISFKTRKGSVIHDSIGVDVNGLTAVEKSGFKIKTLTALVKVTDKEMSLRKLTLETGNSSINNYLGVTYNDLEDFNDFTEKVTLGADFDRAYLSLRDINYFAKNLDAVAHNTIYISGKITGRINNLQGKNIVLTVGNGTILKGNFYTSGLPNFNETSLNMRISQFTTSAAEIRRIYPSTLYPPNFNTLGNISFTGNFDGFLNDFVTQGKLYTDIGSASSDINFKYNSKTAKSAYSGDLALNNFDLGKWFNRSDVLGKISLKTSLVGSGIKLETVDVKLNGDVSSLTVKGYEYQDLKVNGNIKGKFFSGDLIAKDKYLDMNFRGLVDLTEALPRYNFTASIRNAQLRELNLSKDTLNIRGTVTANFIGKKPDDMIGVVIAQDIFVLHKSDSALVHNITLTSTILPDKSKHITLLSDNAEGEMQGKFTFSGMPKAITRYLNYTFTKNYEDTVYVYPQQFTFNMRFYDSSSITRTIDPRFRMIRNSVISGEFNTANHVLNLKGSIPEIVYDKYGVKKFDVNITSHDGQVDLRTSADNFYMSDSLVLDTMVAKLTTEKDEFRFDLLTSDPKNYNKADMTSYIKPVKGGAEIRMDPSAIWLGGNKWSFLPDNLVTVRGKQITTNANGLVFASGKQNIKVDAYLKNDTSTSINLALTETSLSDFLNIFSRKVKDITATINGTVHIEDIFSKPAIVANVEARDFTMKDINIGTIRVNSNMDESLKRVNVTASVAGDKNDIAIKGFYDVNQQSLNLNTDINSLNLSFLNHPFFVKYVKEVKGTARANLTLEGPIKALVAKGTLHINEANVKVSYINTAYTIRNEDIELGDGYFDVGTLEVMDRFNNKAYGTGRIYHDHFKKFTLDLHVTTNLAEFLNTTVKDQPVFYGRIMAKGKIDFTGTIPMVNINAYDCTTQKGTYVNIPINNSYETNKYNFYRFVTPGKDTVRTRRHEARPTTGVNFSVSVDVTPDATVDVILDPSSGDILSSRGRGYMSISIIRGGDFNIRGNYEIEQGSYLFTLQNVINKRFELEPGGSIYFNGDVYNAQLYADAIYKVRTSTYDLIADLLGVYSTNGSTTTSSSETEAVLRSKNRIEVDLLLKLKGVLSAPEISFDIRPQDPDPLIRTYVDNKMQLIRSSDAELNKQVFGLLVMNRFLPTNSAAAGDATSGKSIGGSVANTVSEFLTSQLSMYVGSFFDNLNVKDLDFNLNFQQYDQWYGPATTTADNLNTRRELQIALTKRFFNNRLSINVGGNLDFGDNKSVAGNTQTTTNNPNAYVTGDFQIEYTLDKKGSWRAKTYNRNDYDNFNQRNRNKTGIGLSYRQDFDRWIDLFRRKKKLQPIPMPPAAKPEDTPKVQTPPAK
ncbi:MAG: hypothetical protein JWO03_2230 [Bacteroidetes bacterium]|nr:hypothetical protein [Bacteroidota bacterium]